MTSDCNTLNRCSNIPRSWPFKAPTQHNKITPYFSLQRSNQVQLQHLTARLCFQTSDHFVTFLCPQSFSSIGLLIIRKKKQIPDVDAHYQPCQCHTWMQKSLSYLSTRLVLTLFLQFFLQSQTLTHVSLQFPGFPYENRYFFAVSDFVHF